MTSNFFKIVILNSLLLHFSVSFDQSLNVSGNDVKAAVMSAMVGLSSGGRHKWLSTIPNKNMDAKDFPFLATVVLDDDLLRLHSSCGGAIVSRWHVLTSAQCICDLNPICPKLTANLLYVMVGSTYRWNPQKDAAYQSIKEITMHPEFHKNNFLHDLAMIKIKGAFLLNDKVQIINLPNLNMKDNIKWMEKSDAACTVFGWYIYSPVYITGRFKKESLQRSYAKLNLVTLESCLHKWDKYDILKLNSHVCVRGYIYDEAIENYCIGDGGSSLICGTGRYRYILGVATTSHDCVFACYREKYENIEQKKDSINIFKRMTCSSKAEMPIIFTRVDQYLEFINKIINFSDGKSESYKSSGCFIHSQFVTKYYCTSLTSVLILTFIKKMEF